jgi:hypothetical protein
MGWCDDLIGYNLQAMFCWVLTPREPADRAGWKRLLWEEDSVEGDLEAGTYRSKSLCFLAPT